MAAPRSLAGHAFVAVGSGWLLSFAQDLIRLGTMMVLARLLAPEDYGHFALATSVTAWLSGVGFLNFAPQLLRERGEPEEVATYLLFGLALQTALALIGLTVAAIFWSVWDRQLLAALIALAVLAMPLHVPAQIEAQLLQREFRWRAARLWQLATGMIASGTSIILAWQGAGPFALVAGVLIEPVPLALLLLRTRPINGFRLVPDILARMHEFGWPMVAGSVVWKTRDLLCTWPVGLILGAHALGLSQRAFGTVGLLLGRFSTQAGFSLLPVLSRIAPSPALRIRAGSLLLRGIIWTTVPMAIGLALVAETLVEILYGSNWTEVGPLLPWAAAYGAGYAVITGVMPMLIASGRTRERLMADLWYMLGVIVAVPLLRMGLIPWMTAMAVATWATAAYVLRQVCRCGWVDSEALRTALIPAAAAAAAATASTLAIETLLPGSLDELTAAAIFTAGYGLVLWGTAPAPLRELLALATACRGQTAHAVSGKTPDGTPPDGAVSERTPSRSTAGATLSGLSDV